MFVCWFITSLIIISLDNNYIIDEKLEGYESMTRRESHRQAPSHDGITGIVPHLGAHLAELTTISGNISIFSLYQINNYFSIIKQ